MREARCVAWAVALMATACTLGLPAPPDSGGGTSSGTPSGGALAGSPNAGTPGPGAANGTLAAGGSRVAGNPYAGAVMYQPADYAAAIVANAVPAAAASAADARLVSAAKAFPTGVWLDRIAAIAGGAGNGGRLGVTGHLDAALAQAQAAAKPVAITFVVYDLPNRDCKSKASNGELMGTDGLARYKSAFIDAIVQALTAKKEYLALRVVLIIEPDSLPNMVTNAASVPACQVVASGNLYTDGIAYALKAFAPLTHVSMYLDIAHSGWLGWDDKRAQAVKLYADTITAAGGVGGAIRGLATNIANYSPVQEAGASAADMAALSGSFYQYNKMFDEISFVRALAADFAAAGLPSLGFVIDTSRNGWPAATAGQPQDRRLARGNWCNIKGTGLGPRPQAAPGLDPALDAFVWVKPPGESDGYGQLQNPANSPDGEGKRFDPDCDAANPAHADSMPQAPAAGHWFNDSFMMLLRGAQPPL